MTAIQIHDSPAAGESLALTYLGRATVGDTDYVAYSDGAYRHVVHATTWDRPLTDAERTAMARDNGGEGDAYTLWCQDGLASDEVSVAVARELDLFYIHSTDGTCGRLDVE